MTRRAPLCMMAAGLLLAACSPTVQVAPSEKPIVINMNVKIEHEIRVKLEKELDAVLSPESGLF